MMTRYLGALVAALAVISISASPVYAGKDHKDGHKEGKYHRMMKKVDANGDGVISREEADAHHAMRFAKMDTDGDGNISKEEMKAHHKEMRERHKGKGDRDDD